jgi:hypothetical protein
MHGVLRCWADDAVVKELANALETAGFERGDECLSERARASYAVQPQLHAGVASLEEGEEERLFWQRIDAALDALAPEITRARAAGAELEIDLDSQVRLELELPAETPCIDEVHLPHATLARLGRLEIDFRVSMYRLRDLSAEPDARGSSL